ncbi:MAG: acetyl-CoA carboxylase biotin carboxyl carrier protein subunit [Bacteroidota bacterium]
MGKKLNVLVNERTIEVLQQDENTIFAEGKKYDVSHKQIDKSHHSFIINGKSYEVIRTEQRNGKQTILLNGKEIVTEIQDDVSAIMKKFQSSKKENHNYEILSPMPGLIATINITIGESVKPGTKLCVLEAMKMENDIVSQREGMVKEIFVEERTIVEKGIKLMSIG